MFSQVQNLVQQNSKYNETGLIGHLLQNCLCFQRGDLSTQGSQGLSMGHRVSERGASLKASTVPRYVGHEEICSSASPFFSPVLIMKVRCYLSYFVETKTQDRTLTALGRTGLLGSRFAGDSVHGPRQGGVTEHTQCMPHIQEAEIDRWGRERDLSRAHPQVPLLKVSQL